MDVQSLSKSYLRARQAEGLAPTTLKLYRDCIGRFCLFLEQETGSDALSGVSRRVLTDYFAVRAATCAPATVWTDWKALRLLVRWLYEEQEIASDPMGRMKSPRQASKPVPVLVEAQLTALVAACAGNGWRERRDLAAMRLLIEGMRRGEVVGLFVGHVQLDAGLVTVTGKGKTRTVAIGAKTVAALDRWLRCSRNTQSADRVFGLTPSGLYQAMRARADIAGVAGFHPHRLRHTAAHRWLVAGGNEGDLMETLGWSSPSMLRRYGVSAAAERARAAQRSLGLSDRI